MGGTVGIPPRGLEALLPDPGSPVLRLLCLERMVYFWVREEVFPAEAALFLALARRF